MNLLLVSIDSLRLDYVSRTHPRIHTPDFDHLTRSFYFCSRCFSPSSATRPVHTSVFTGLYPFEHGVRGQHSPRMRAGLPHLFALFAARRYALGAFSEAPTVFSGLDFASGIAPLSRRRDLEKFLDRHARRPSFLFVHYWSAHTPYGAADGRAMGETAHLLRHGKGHLVRQRYARAVEDIFERKLAPLLVQLDMRQWGVALFGDHGESWSTGELYHGQTLSNSVLRVPLYLHLPGATAYPSPERLLSLVDLFPTLVTHFGLAVDYRGGGRDILGAERAPHYFAQIDPAPEPEHTSPPGLAGRQWALFDEEYKFTCWEQSGEGRLERTLSEERLCNAEVEARYREAGERLQAESPYLGAASEAIDASEKELLDKRLRALGYL